MQFRYINTGMEQQALWDDACRYIAGGVVSLNRKVTPLIAFRRAYGSKLVDRSGRVYIDYHAAFSPFLLGHNREEVNEAVRRSMCDQWSLMGTGPTEWEVELARRLCEAVESVDAVQLTNTGSEATALAIRLSRAFTKREEIVLPLGGYNGWQDDVARVVVPTLEAIGPRRTGRPYTFLPASAGIPKSVQERAHVVNFNDLESLDHVLRNHEIACVLLEPVLQNIGVVRPRPGYLQSVIELCERFGAVCIFDEVKTGFRSALGGFQSLAGVRPHLSVFGKAVANGFPIGVVGGRREIMNLFDAPGAEDRVLIAGTYNAHPVSCAAALATLDVLSDPNTYAAIDAACEELYSGTEAILAERGIPATLARNRSAFCIYLMERAPVDFHDILTYHDFARDIRLREELIARGIYHIPIPCKQGSVSLAHTIADIGRTLEMTREAVARVWS